MKNSRKAEERERKKQRGALKILRRERKKNEKRQQLHLGKIRNKGKSENSVFQQFVRE